MRDSQFDLIEELSYEKRQADIAFAVPIETRKAEARRRQSAGERPCCSTGIHEYITYGYGRLDPNGFWELPLPDGEFVGETRTEEPK
jgi:hypothetical protein